MEYNKMTPTSKVWVYQSNRKLTPTEVEKIKAQTDEFEKEWDSHGKILTANISIFHHLFIVTMADDDITHVGGCSIDKSESFLKKLGKSFNIDFFDRRTIAFINQNNEMEVCSFDDFQILLDQGKVNDETIVFNNMVRTKNELENNWKVAFGKSWHKRMFSVTA